MIRDLIIAKRKRKEHDFSVTAFRAVQDATERVKEPSKLMKVFDPVVLGHFGGLKGGKARAASLTFERRTEIANKVA